MPKIEMDGKIVRNENIDRIRQHLDDVEKGLPASGFLGLFKPGESYCLVSGTLDDMTEHGKVLASVKQAGIMFGAALSQMFTPEQPAQVQILALQAMMQGTRDAFCQGVYKALRQAVNPDTKLRLATMETATSAGLDLRQGH